MNREVRGMEGGFVRVKDGIGKTEVNIYGGAVLMFTFCLSPT